jgi:hypothetical protein
MVYKLGKIRELIDEALTLGELEDICFGFFNKVYQEHHGKERSIITRALIDYANRQSKFEILLEQIKSKNKYCFDKYRHKIKDFVPIEIRYFDLTDSIERSWEEIYGEKGIIGLSVACISTELINNFSDRLKEKLSDKHTKVSLEGKQVFDPTKNPAHKIVKTITIKTNKLKKGTTVIFPIVVDDRDPSELWKSLQQSFQNKSDFCLVVIIFGNLSYTSISNDVISLNPKFKRSHLRKWIDDVTSALNTKQTTEAWTTIRDSWEKRATEYCEPDSMGNLNIELVYEHLEETLTWIGDDDLEISPVEFLEQLTPQK